MTNDEFIDTPVPNNNQLTRIAELGKEFVDLSHEIRRLETLLELRKKAFNLISTSQLPDAMRDVGMREFRLANGYRIAVKPVMVCQLPKQNIDEAEKWLTDNGHIGIMKRSLEIPLKRNISHEELEGLKKVIASMDYSVNEAKSIHYQTLQKFAREMQEEGEVLPEEIFTVYHSNKTEIEV